MAKFADLPESERIQTIKDGFVLLLARLVQNPGELAEYLKSESPETIQKIEKVVSTFQKKEGCLCGTCINVNVANGAVPIELEPLIDLARKEAESKSY